jgi:glycosyltransferase involved in cell wall biosynthesis
LKAGLIPRLVRAFDGVLAPSSAAAHFAHALGVPPQAVFLVPYVIDNDFFRERASQVDRAAARAPWGIPDKATLALFCGKLVSRKRPLDLLLAAARVDDVHTLFVGDGVLRGELEHTAAALGIAGRTHFSGFVNQTELPAVYRAADVLVLPSAHEPFGLVVNEAFACGIPAIVSSACGSAGDLVQEGRTGYVVPVGAVETLAARLHLLANDPALQEAMSREASRLIEDWGPRQHVASFAEACLTLAAKKNRRSRPPAHA